MIDRKLLGKDSHTLEQELREVNEALLISSVEQHQLREKAEQAEAQLRASEQKYRALFETIQDGYCIIERVEAGTSGTLDFRFVDANPAFAIQTGIENVVGRTIRETFSEDAESLIQISDDVLRTGHSARIDRGQINQGRVFEVNAFRVEFKAGHHVALVSTDVTERKLLEKIALETNQRFRFIAESVPQKIFTATPDGHFNYFNHEWMSYTGLKFEDLQGDGWTKCVHPGDVSKTLVAWKQAVQTGVPFSFEHRIRGEDGQYRWHLSRAHVLTCDNGAVGTWVGSTSDVDDVRRENEAYQAQLELDVQRRTEDLLEVNEQLQGFTYSVAHDLRQQIRGISSNASILMLDSCDVLDGQCLDTIQRLKKNAQRLATLVDDLLAYARLGKQMPQRVPVDLSALAGEVIAYLTEEGTCSPTAVFEVEPGLTLQGDAAMVRIVVENLLNNACKYSAKRERPVIKVGKLADAFFVEDNGTGFDMQYAHKLFQPFERLHRGTDYEGTGIGLANVRRIVEKHGGKVWAEGTPDVGATFFFSMAPSKGAERA